MFLNLQKNKSTKKNNLDVKSQLTGWNLMAWYPVWVGDFFGSNPDNLMYI